MNRLHGHWGVLMLATAAAAIAFHWLTTWLLPPPGVEERLYLRAVFPDAYGFTEKVGKIPLYQAFTLDRQGSPEAIGAVFRSTEVAEVPRGYAGPVPVMIGLSREGTITGVRLLEHNETPSYVTGIEKQDFLRQFVGRTVSDPVRLEEDIDGVTRATVTAAAVTDGVRLAARSVAGKVMGLPVPEEKSPPSPILWPSLCALALLFLVALASTAWRGRHLRWPSLLLGLAVLGYWQGIYLSTATAANILLWRWPSWEQHLFWYVLVAFGFTAAIIWRNVYCARMCPFGALQELVHLVSPRPLEATADEDRQARRLRYVFLWLVVLAVFLFGRTDVANYEPFSTAFDFKGGTLRWALLVVVLLLASVRHRFWCRYFCPTGLWLQLLGRMRSLNPFD